MANQISLRGFVSSEIESSTLDSGLVIGKFRMGSNIRRLDPITNKWVDGKTNWFRVNTFRSLASNTIVSIHKGDRILVVGKLRVTSFLRKDGTPGTGVEIDAESIGPDLQFGTASYHRMASARPAGQGNTSYADAPAYSESHSPGDIEDQEHGVFGSAGPNHGDQDSEDLDDDDGQAAALARDDSVGSDGLEPDEHADLQTGEISKEMAPY